GDFADGVCFVDLVPVTDPGRIGAAVAAAVGVTGRAGAAGVLGVARATAGCGGAVRGVGAGVGAGAGTFFSPSGV
ncbi:hypothetical protein AB0K09_32110, partial [Streptomyces sp. NPDC049577]